MSHKEKLIQELKGLGKDLGQAAKKMKSSPEFKSLEKAVSRAVKSISQGLLKSLVAAKKSPTTKKIKNRLRNVLKEGRKQGKMGASRAQAAAARGIKKARAKLNRVSGDF